MAAAVKGRSDEPRLKVEVENSSTVSNNFENIVVNLLKITINYDKRLEQGRSAGSPVYITVNSL
jgi:hypothetical protein